MAALCADFERNVEQNLRNLGISVQKLKKEGGTICVGVSGGADSVSLLCALVKIFSGTPIKVVAVSVNHNIREKEVSAEDSLFVQELCNNFAKNGNSVSCIIKEIPCGTVAALAEKRGAGLEEAARFVRYKEFESVIQELNPVCFCLAHNKNDYIETLLMRFLQGSDIDSLCGIQDRRGLYVRPLLSVSRTQIEEYLLSLGLKWRTDSTNFDEHYLRNKIRRKLVPFLEKNFFGYEKALLSGSRKMQVYSDFFAEIEETTLFSILHKEGNSAFINLNDFYSLHGALKNRAIIKLFSAINHDSPIRLSYSFIEDFIRKLETSREDFSSDFADTEFIVRNGKISVKKRKILATEQSFFVIIEKTEEILLPFFGISAFVHKNLADIAIYSEQDSVTLYDVPVPCCVRSRLFSDMVSTVDGGAKSVSDILSGWHVGLEQKNLVPIVQEMASSELKICAVIGSVLGFENWIVKG